VLAPRHPPNDPLRVPLGARVLCTLTAHEGGTLCPDGVTQVFLDVDDLKTGKGGEIVDGCAFFLLFLSAGCTRLDIHLRFT
jgi:hypothetical protein